MHEKSDNPAPRSAARQRRLRRHTAAGKKINYSLGLLTAILLYVSVVLLTPRLTAYELKGAMRTVCMTFMNATMFSSSDRSLAWQKEWEQRHNNLAIPLREDQWAFTASSPCEKKRGCSCTGEAVFELTTPWFLLEDFIDIKPYKSTHHVKQYVEWKSHY